MRDPDVLSIGASAMRPNPGLRPLSFLLGDWLTSGSHPAFPKQVLPGATSFTWDQGGAFLLMRSQTDHPAFPDGIAVFGSDSVLGAITMCWFDERGVSRLCSVSVTAREVAWHHNDPAFMQRVRMTASEDGLTIVSKGEMARGGKGWGPDLSQTFRRRKQRSV